MYNASRGIRKILAADTGFAPVVTESRSQFT
jgi:hypothetical protein